MPGLRSLLQAVWMGGRGMRLRRCLYLGFSGLAILLELVETSGVWPQGLLDAFFAMIPKADGDSTSWVNGPSVCSRLCTGCGPPFGLDILGSGL